MNASTDDKSELRRYCKAERSGIAGNARAEAEEKIRRGIRETAGYRQASLLLFYAPIGSEADIFPLAEEALREGRAIALPRCEDKPGVMTFRQIERPDELTIGRYGVREPKADARVIGARELLGERVFALIPGLAFDTSGARLGYGKGYYDRFLAEFGGFSLGVTFEKLIFDRLPKGEYDRSVDGLASELGVRMVHA